MTSDLPIPHFAMKLRSGRSLLAPKTAVQVRRAWISTHKGGIKSVYKRLDTALDNVGYWKARQESAELYIQQLEMKIEELNHMLERKLLPPTATDWNNITWLLSPTNEERSAINEELDFESEFFV